MSKNLPRWTAADDILLIHWRESADIPAHFYTVKDQFPNRTERACTSHYLDLVRRVLKPHQLQALEELWERNQEPMFGDQARLCGITIDDYQRVAFTGTTIEVQLPDDINRIDCLCVINTYYVSCRKIWRVITSQVPGVSWMQAEQHCRNRHVRLGRVEEC